MNKAEQKKVDDLSKTSSDIERVVYINSTDKVVSDRTGQSYLIAELETQSPWGKVNTHRWLVDNGIAIAMLDVKEGLYKVTQRQIQGETRTTSNGVTILTDKNIIVKAVPVG